MQSERYMVVSSGVKDGQAYSILNLIREGTKKDSKDIYAFLDSKLSIKELETLQLGEIHTYERKRTSLSPSNKFMSKTKE